VFRKYKARNSALFLFPFHHTLMDEEDAAIARMMGVDVGEIREQEKQHTEENENWEKLLEGKSIPPETEKKKEKEREAPPLLFPGQKGYGKLPHKSKRKLACERPAMHTLAEIFHKEWRKRNREPLQEPVKDDSVPDVLAVLDQAQRERLSELAKDNIIKVRSREEKAQLNTKRKRKRGRPSASSKAKEEEENHDNSGVTLWLPPPPPPGRFAGPPDWPRMADEPEPPETPARPFPEVETLGLRFPIVERALPELDIKQEISPPESLLTENIAPAGASWLKILTLFDPAEGIPEPWRELIFALYPKRDWPLDPDRCFRKTLEMAVDCQHCLRLPWGTDGMYIYGSLRQVSEWLKHAEIYEWLWQHPTEPLPEGCSLAVAHWGQHVWLGKIRLPQVPWAADDSLLTAYVDWRYRRLGRIRALVSSWSEYMFGAALWCTVHPVLHIDPRHQTPVFLTDQAARNAMERKSKRSTLSTQEPSTDAIYSAYPFKTNKRGYAEVHHKLVHDTMRYIQPPEGSDPLSTEALLSMAYARSYETFRLTANRTLENSPSIEIKALPACVINADSGRERLPLYSGSSSRHRTHDRVIRTRDAKEERGLYPLHILPPPHAYLPLYRRYFEATFGRDAKESLWRTLPWQGHFEVMKAWLYATDDNKYEE
jgi:hypothetical protein